MLSFYLLLDLVSVVRHRLRHSITINEVRDLEIRSKIHCFVTCALYFTTLTSYVISPSCSNNNNYSIHGWQTKQYMELWSFSSMDKNRTHLTKTQFHRDLYSKYKLSLFFWHNCSTCKDLRLFSTSLRIEINKSRNTMNSHTSWKQSTPKPVSHCMCACIDYNTHTIIQIEFITDIFVRTPSVRKVFFCHNFIKDVPFSVLYNAKQWLKAMPKSPNIYICPH